MAIWIHEGTESGIETSAGLSTSPSTQEVLHRMVGGLQVAREIVGRSRGLYASTTHVPDEGVLSCMAIVTDVLGRLVEALDARSGEPAA